MRTVTNEHSTLHSLVRPLVRSFIHSSKQARFEPLKFSLALVLLLLKLNTGSQTPSNGTDHTYYVCATLFVRPSTTSFPWSHDSETFDPTLLYAFTFLPAIQCSFGYYLPEPRFEPSGLALAQRVRSVQEEVA